MINPGKKKKLRETEKSSNVYSNTECATVTDRN